VTFRHSRPLPPDKYIHHPSSPLPAPRRAVHITHGHVCHPTAPAPTPCPALPHPAQVACCDATARPPPRPSPTCSPTDCVCVPSALRHRAVIAQAPHPHATMSHPPFVSIPTPNQGVLAHVRRHGRAVDVAPPHHHGYGGTRKPCGQLAMHRPSTRLPQPTSPTDILHRRCNGQTHLMHPHPHGLPGGRQLHLPIHQTRRQRRQVRVA